MLGREVPAISKGPIMVRHEKQYNSMGMVDNKQKFKVKEEEAENIKMEEKMKKHKVESDKKAEEKQNSLKRKMTKYKEEKEKKTRGVDKKDDEEKEREDRRKRKENENKAKSHKERKDENENGKEEQKQREIEKEKEEKQKEINVQKGRKENDKEEKDPKEREEKDQNGKKSCPQFFRVFMSDSFMEHVTIPLGFHKYLEECTGMVSLRGPSGNKWSVELTKISGELCFARGWKEFLYDHRVRYGYLLVFRYDGQSQFSVTVFLPSSCEAPYASLAQPQHKDVDVAGEEEKGLTITNADGNGITPQEDDAHTDTDTSADGTPQNEASEEEDASEEEEEEEEVDSLSESPEIEENSECRMCSVDALEPARQQQEDGHKTDDGFVLGKRARFRKIDDIMAELDRSNKSKPSEGKNSQAPVGDSSFEEATSSDSLAEESEHHPPKKSKAEEIRSPSGDSSSKAAASSDNLSELATKESKAEGKSSAAPLIVYTRSAASASKKASEGAASSDNLAVHTGVFAPESVCRDLTTWHKTFGKRHSKQNQFPMFNKSNGENQRGRALIKVMRRPGLTSQRRPVTQRDKEYAMERALWFKSERPFTVKTMKHNDVYASYFMIIPAKFVKTFLPKESMKMTLWDPQAKPWKVWYEYYGGGECPRAAFSAGWGALAMENNLEKWDVCVFELLDQEYNIKLHVYRAVLMITPCVRAPKPRTDEW
ncbi:B3 domain-containing protein Os11g0197600-like isoform X1 [Hordeum vulgare subsp. vulgare]|uniref:B3 domain-containing protein Os11g0197600-like isoform X1 n=2 Tax=Hordeum vulgare subsp. vulgare TaxID=112509 RepID=UPI001D1A330C|nr:B3 domain-containing protein Os11g0197600-like isoform X1 [Hordeum vulgare subsp. vulgare]